MWNWGDASFLDGLGGWELGDPGEIKSGKSLIGAIRWHNHDSRTLAIFTFQVEIRFDRSESGGVSAGGEPGIPKCWGKPHYEYPEGRRECQVVQAFTCLLNRVIYSLDRQVTSVLTIECISVTHHYWAIPWCSASVQFSILRPLTYPVSSTAERQPGLYVSKIRLLDMADGSFLKGSDIVRSTFFSSIDWLIH